MNRLRILLGVFCFLINHSLSAEETCQPVGKIASAQGNIEIQRNNSETWLPAALDQALCQGDTLRLGSNSRAALALINDAVLRLDQNTTIRLVNIVAEPKQKSWLDLLSGALQSFSRKPHLMNVNTPYLNGSIEGTEYALSIQGESTQLAVFEGTVIASNALGSVAVPGGSAANASKGSAPLLRTLINPREGVQWALYYPLVLQAGDPALAQAQQLLALGRADQAGAQLQSLLSLQPDNAQALSLLAIIQLVQNQNNAAIENAALATQLAPEAASGWIALSYAQQAQFDLHSAREAAQSATLAEPNNALAWTRLAELQAAFGDLKLALTNARKAVELQPQLARSHSLLGFTQLLQLDIEAALAEFELAITLDQADPLPHLGKGLGLIRQGELVEGRREIELAVGLDGNQALLHAYLGKSYYEEKRSDLAAIQFTTAQQLDPQDPTAPFYAAILQQSLGQPIAALQSMQTVVALNDNRAVYRSRLLLDSDQAARSASLGGIFSALGFEELALVEGWKSVNLDPGNFSAHRLLADSYAAKPRHEIARVSELLQAQLLQPINSAPLLPSLGESDLFLLTSSGPSKMSFNEYNSLFNRDGMNLLLSGLGGSNNTQGEEVVVNGILSQFSGSLGLSHFETDGWRTNAFQDDDIANLLLQAELAPGAGLQLEYRYRDTQFGDLGQRFLPDQFFPGQHNQVTRESVRLGGHLVFSPGSQLLGYVQYQETESSLVDEQWPEPEINVISAVSLWQPETNTAAELQHLLQRERWNLSSGVGYFHTDAQVDSTLFIYPPYIPDIGVDSVAETSPYDVRHLNAYSYARIELLEQMTLTLGLSVDDVSGDFGLDDKTKVNPKLGLVWNPVANTTLRAAAFSTLRRTLSSNQTLEPTQVAGFNQFFDDFDLTEADVYGLAIDQKFTPRLFGGIEYFYRDISVPQYGLGPNGETVDVPWEDKIASLYLAWTPSTHLAFSAKYFYEQFLRDPQQGVQDLERQRLPLQARYFFDAGLDLSLTLNYIETQGDFTGMLGDRLIAGDDSVWLTDAALNYTLPKRLGSVSLNLNNIFDEQYQYFEIDLSNVHIQPERNIFIKLTLTLP